jgi:hypothetical protein
MNAPQDANPSQTDIEHHADDIPTGTFSTQVTQHLPQASGERLETSDNDFKPPLVAAASNADELSPVIESSVPSGDQPSVDVQPAVNPPQVILFPDDAAEGVRTGIGGMWYLVNVLDDLGAFDDEWAELDPWVALGSLTNALLDGMLPDPVWEMLAGFSRLDGRDYRQAMQHPAVYRWAARVGEPVRETLTAAGIDDVPVLLAQRAVLHATLTHIDVMFPLQQIDLRLRRTGLDRNPGWVPSFGRVFTFSYE